MNARLLSGIGVAALATAGCGLTTTVIETPSPSHGLHEQVVQLRDAAGGVIGTVTLSSMTVEAFSPSPASASPSTSAGTSPSGSAGGPTGPEPGTTGVHLHVVIDSLPPGSHGFHVHMFGRCDPPDFTSAGGHFNPFGTRHGFGSSGGPHAGDLGNITAGADGKVTVDLVSALMTLEQDKPNSIVGTADGAAIIVHARPDDEVTQPAGNSGPRIACGVISQATPAAETPSPEATPTPSPSPTPSRRSVTPAPVRRPTATPSPSFGHGTGLEGAGVP